MEIRLKFKEKEFRELYEHSYESTLADLENKVIGRRKTRNVLLILSGITLLLTFAHRDWIYYGLIFLFIAFLFIGWTEIEKLKTKRVIQRNRNEVNDFVAKTKLKKDIKYSYDDDVIQYCESGEVIDRYLWKDLSSLENNTEYFIIHFANNKPTIMIPRTMVESEEELLKFENKIQENLKNAR